MVERPGARVGRNQRWAAGTQDLRAHEAGSRASSSLALLAAGPAAAGLLTSAQLRVEIGALPTVTFPATGATGQTLGNLEATVDAGTAFAGTVITSVTDPAAVPISGIYVYMDSNDAGAFTGSPLGGAATFRGPYDLQAYSLVLLSVPLRLGGAVTETRSELGINLSAISDTWTAGTASVWLPGATAPQVRTGSNELTPGGAGRLLLVSPLTVLTNLGGAGTSRVSASSSWSPCRSRVPSRSWPSGWRCSSRAGRGGPERPDRRRRGARSSPPARMRGRLVNTGRRSEPAQP